MSGEPKPLTQMTPREAWEHAWEQAIDACRVFEEEAAAKQLEAVRNLGRQMLDQDQEEEGVPVVARDEAAELRAAVREYLEAGDTAHAATTMRSVTDDEFDDLLKRKDAAFAALRRLAGGENEK